MISDAVIGYSVGQMLCVGQCVGLKTEHISGQRRKMVTVTKQDGFTKCKSQLTNFTTFF